MRETTAIIPPQPGWLLLEMCPQTGFLDGSDPVIAWHVTDQGDWPWPDVGVHPVTASGTFPGRPDGRVELVWQSLERANRPAACAGGGHMRLRGLAR